MTGLLQAWSGGDAEALEQLVPLVHRELREMARRMLSGERLAALPAELQPLERNFSVILAMEPGQGSVALRALKDHDSRDVSALHVALDPKTLLLVRS